MTKKELVEALNKYPDEYKVVAWNMDDESWCEVDRLTVSTYYEYSEIELWTSPEQDY